MYPWGASMGGSVAALTLARRRGADYDGELVGLLSCHRGCSVFHLYMGLLVNLPRRKLGVEIMVSSHQ